MNRRLLVLSGVLLVWGGIFNYVNFSKAVPLRKPLSSLPAQIGDWKGTPEAYSEEIVGVLGVTDYISRQYQRGGEEVDVYVGYYASQGSGKQIHSPKHCLPGTGWNVVSEETSAVDLAGVGKLSLVKAVYEKDGSRWLFMYWYRTKDAYVTNDYLLKWRMILNSVRYRRNEATFVRLASPITSDEGRAFEVVRGFMAEFVPHLQEHLPL